MRIWKDIKGFETVYQVSNKGEVRRLDTLVPFSGTMTLRKGRCLKPAKNSKGYLTLVLCYKSKRCTKTVHQLVADSFILKVPSLTQVNHIDGNPLNNSLCNLERCTPFYNQLHSYKMNGRKNPIRKLTELEVIEVKKRPNMRRKALAKKFNVTEWCIKQIRAGKTWSHVTVED